MDEAYRVWQANPSEDNFDAVLKKLQPTINTGLKTYGGNDPSLESRATLLAAKAVKTYKPDKGTQLRTHVMTQLQPLIR